MNELLRSGFRLYGKLFGLILSLVLTIGLPCQILSSYLAYEVFGKKYFVPALLQTGTLIELLFGVVLTGGLLQALFADTMGRRATYWECLSVGVSHWWPLCWTNFLLTSLVFMGSILFFLPIDSWLLRIVLLLPALFLAIRLSLANTVIISEGEWGTAALRRSLALTARKSGPILGLYLLLYLPTRAVGLIGIGLLQTNPWLDNWPTAAAFGLALQLFSCLLPICLYGYYEKIIAEDQAEE
jgi:hypothetical protein